MRLIYIGDPLCSWCWGIAPEIDRLMSLTSLPLEVVVGGLRPGPSAEPMRPSMESYLRGAWSQVAERTGQPFDTAILNNHDWTYDTEPACRAVVTMRNMLPEDTFPFFKRVQRAFYAEASLTFEDEHFRPLLADHDVDADAFLAEMSSQEVAKETWKDFSWARSIGVTAFPVVVVETDEGIRPIALGYTTTDTMFERLVDALPAEVAAATCSIDGDC